jgi:citrate lyase subunit beta / citryl-CoA lyase
MVGGVAVASSSPMMLMRSSLYVPGDRPERFEKALASGADGVILDLEDAVAPASKMVALGHVCDFLSARSGVVGGVVGAVVGGPRVLVRINQGARGVDDAAALVEAGGAAVAGLFIPKVSAVDEILAVDHAVDRGEARAHIKSMSVPFFALIETAAGVFNATTIALHPRVKQLAMGEADLSAELGVELIPGDERELLTARSLVVMASAAAALDPPIGPVSVNFRDLVSLAASAEMLRRLGFRGCSAIHPAQVPVLNKVFTPTVEQLRAAERVVEIFDASVADGVGAVADDNGKMIDEAVARSARRVIAQRALIES